MNVPPRVLVVRLGAIGDVVNALVFASALKQAAPDVHLGWAVHPLAEPLVNGHPAVDRVHLWPKGAGLGGFWRVLREIRGERYELAVDLQRIQKSALLARLSGAKRVLGYDRARAKELSWLWSRERLTPGSPTAHMVEQYMEFAQHLGLGAGVQHQFPSDPAAEAQVERLLKEMGGAPVLINLGATKPANRWAPERFGQLAVEARGFFGPPVAFTGGPTDQAVAAEARRAAEGADGIFDLVGKTSLRELVALEARARLWIGCDTGPMHIAAALGVPVVALFGPADPRRTGPWGSTQRVVRVPPACAPCGRRHCNQARHACMEDISVAHVIEAAKSVLAGVPIPHRAEPAPGDAQREPSRR